MKGVKEEGEEKARIFSLPFSFFRIFSPLFLRLEEDKYKVKNIQLSTFRMIQPPVSTRHMQKSHSIRFYTSLMITAKFKDF